jgi:DNA-binding GntR family transcriptional regulator
VLAPIERAGSFAELAYRAIKAAILSLELPPGSQLAERQLGDLLHVSKTPIREALARLEREGFAVTLPYRGTLVTTLTHDDIREIFDLRALLEGHAVLEAIPNFSAADLKQLHGLVDQAAAATARDDPTTCFQANHDFHQMSIDRVWNQRLRSQLTNLSDHARRIRAATAPVWRLLGLDLKYHRELVAAAERGDAEAACAAIRRDIKEFERRLLTHTSSEMLTLLGSDAPSSAARAVR